MKFYSGLFRTLIILLLLAACSTVSEKTEPIGSSPQQPVNVQPARSQPSSLNAGEIDDNTDWDQHVQYRNAFLQSGNGFVRNVDVNDRQLITVRDDQGLPILGARVLVYGGQSLITESCTYATGETLFSPKAWAAALDQQSYRVVLQKGDQAVEFTLDPQAGSAWDVKLDSTPSSSVKLDVLFLLDSTGSMGDEIAQLQNNILTISDQVNNLSNDVEVRYGLVIYRDRGDAYVTQAYDFVSDVSDFQSRLRTVRADGGGDIPESVNEALHVAVQGVTWRGADTIKLIFLVADAAPHLDYANDYDYSQEMIAAAWQGIKIHPIASSGLTTDGEFIFRQIAQYTMGHFVFLTYQQGTGGDPGTKRTDLAAGQQGDYSVEQLDDLVLKLIINEIAALSVPVQGGGVIPKLKTAALQPVNSIPAAFALARPPAQAAYVASPINDMSVSRSVSAQLSISMPVLLLIVAVCLVVGYSLNANRRVEKRKRKRKNEELIIEAED